MLRETHPFAIDARLGPQLESVLDYWRGLLRGEASMPFADDVDLVNVRGRCPDVFVLDVLERPQRFRMAVAVTPGAPIIADELAGRFMDEVDLPTPLDYVRAQADSTVESLGPTLYRHVDDVARAYARLLLPAWGEGQVRLLLGAIEWL